jgi:hypothetical protein
MTTESQQQAVAVDVSCAASPSGAHYWMIGSPGKSMVGVCKYCETSREFRPFEDRAGFNGSPGGQSKNTKPQGRGERTFNARMAA